MAVALSPIGGAGAQFFDNNGNPLVGGKIYTYEAGTTTPAATYTTLAGTTAHTNPIILDSAGRVPGGEIWLTLPDFYKFVLKTSADVTIGTYDNIQGYSSGSIAYAATETQTATAGQTLFVLTEMFYNPGTNTLAVFIDGVNQVVNNSYVESTSTSVTFMSGLHVGAVVKFVNITVASTDATTVTYEPGFTGSVATTVAAKLQQTVSVKDFGAVGDGVADDTAAIQAALDSGASKVIIGQGTFNITDTISCPAEISLDFDSGTISYAGTRDRPAMQIGTPTTNAGLVDVLGVRIVSETTDWSDIDFVGLRVYSARRARIIVDRIKGFTIGYECYSSSGGYAYNYHEILQLTDNKYAMALTCDGTYPDDFTNENIFMGGRYGNSSSSNALGSAYGVWFRSINGGYQNHNMNRWFSPCFELLDGVLGDERIPFLFDDCGIKNTCYNARHETGRGAFAKLNGATYAIQDNNFEVGALGGSFSVSGIDQIGLSRNNFYWPVEKQNVSQRQSITYDVVHAVKSYDSTNASASGGLCFGTSASGSALLNATGVTSRRNSVQLSNRSLGFFVQVDGGEQFSLHSQTDSSGTAGRVGVAAYDANFVQLTNASATYPDVIGPTYSSSYGGIYQRGTDGNSTTFRLSSVVKYIRVFAMSGSNSCWLQSLTLTRTDGNNDPLRCFNDIDVSPTALFAGANPNTGVHGIYGRGDILQNALAASGQPSYWQCVTAGRLAPAWASTTAYVVGAIVLNDTNKIYACVTAGTSAGAGGPTGTGTAIADGSVVWDYISPLATFLAGANLP